MSSEDIATDVSQHQDESVVPPVQQERMVPQSEVDKIVHAKIMRERERLTADSSQSQMPLNKEELLQEAAQMMQKQMDEQRQAQEREHQKAQAEEVARTYYEKMGQGKDLYQDFEEVTGEFNPGTYWQVATMATQHDNTPAIIYELEKNPRKLVDLHMLALTDPPRARKEMAKLSQSIKDNQGAIANNVKSPSPLSKLKSSAVAGQDTGKRTISDLRKDSRFKV